MISAADKRPTASDVMRMPCTLVRAAQRFGWWFGFASRVLDGTLRRVENLRDSLRQEAQCIDEFRHGSFDLR
jgi:hypothetical protein